MANNFNLTARMNIVGPYGIKPVIDKLNQSLKGLKATVNINIAKGTTQQLTSLRKELGLISKVLRDVDISSRSASANITKIAAAFNAQAAAAKTANTALTKTKAQVASVGKAAKRSSDEMAEFGRVSGLAFRRFTGFAIATGAIFGIVNAIKVAVKESLQFQDELVKISQTTKISTSNLFDLTNEITRLAVTFGVSSKELLTTSRTLAQAGFTATETKQALESLAKASLAPSFGDMTSTVEGTIAAMRQFELQSNQLEGALGSINAVAAAFAVESDDIIQAVKRSGGAFAAASAGIGSAQDRLNEFLALFTSVRATTRESAESIATGLRTIFTRIQRGTTITQLREFGVELTELNSEGNRLFVGPYEAIKRLSQALRTLDPKDIRFSGIVEELGGFRQISKVIPLIQQFSTAEKALAVARKGTTSLTEDAARAQESLLVQMAKVREQFLALFRDISKTDAFQIMVKGALQLVQALIQVGQYLKPILPLLAGFAAIKTFQVGATFLSGFSRGVRGAGGAGSLGERLGGGTTTLGQAATTTAQTNSLSGNTSATIANTNAITALTAVLRSIPLFRTKHDGGLLRFAAGGEVPNRGRGSTDSQMVMAQGGEFILNRRGVKTLGKDTLRMANGGIFDKTESRRVKEGFGSIEKFKEGSRFSKEFGAIFLRGPSKIDEKIVGRVPINSIVPSDKRTLKLPNDRKIEVLPSFLGLNKNSKDLSYVLHSSVLPEPPRREIIGIMRNRVAKAINESASVMNKTFSLGQVDVPKISNSFLKSINIDNIIGNLFEASLIRAGLPWNKDKGNQPFDFPRGVGGHGNLGTFFPHQATIPTDAKSTYNFSNIATINKKVAQFFKSHIAALTGFENLTSRHPAGKTFTKELFASQLGISSGQLTQESFKNFPLNQLATVALKGNKITAVTTILGSNTPEATKAALFKELGGNKYTANGIEDVVKNTAVPLTKQEILELKRQEKALARKKKLGLASGGHVNAVLTPGELVFDPQATRNVGLAKLHSINQTGKFARGGSVSVVPGYGNSDSVPAQLANGSFVVRKSSAKNLMGFAQGGSVQAKRLIATNPEFKRLLGQMVYLAADKGFNKKAQQELIRIATRQVTQGVDPRTAINAAGKAISRNFTPDAKVAGRRSIEGFINIFREDRANKKIAQNPGDAKAVIAKIETSQNIKNLPKNMERLSNQFGATYKHMQSVDDGLSAYRRAILAGQTAHRAEIQAVQAATKTEQFYAKATRAPSIIGRVAGGVRGLGQKFGPQASTLAFLAAPIVGGAVGNRTVGQARAGGALSGGLAGAAIGGSIGGPIGLIAGALIGAISGGLSAGKEKALELAQKDLTQSAASLNKSFEDLARSSSKLNVHNVDRALARSFERIDTLIAKETERNTSIFSSKTGAANTLRLIGDEADPNSLRTKALRTASGNALTDAGLAIAQITDLINGQGLGGVEVDRLVRSRIEKEFKQQAITISEQQRQLTPNIEEFVFSQIVRKGKTPTDNQLRAIGRTDDQVVLKAKNAAQNLIEGSDEAIAKIAEIERKAGEERITIRKEEQRKYDELNSALLRANERIEFTTKAFEHMGISIDKASQAIIPLDEIIQRMSGLSSGNLAGRSGTTVNNPLKNLATSSLSDIQKSIGINRRNFGTLPFFEQSAEATRMAKLIQGELTAFIKSGIASSDLKPETQQASVIIDKIRNSNLQRNFSIPDATFNEFLRNFENKISGEEGKIKRQDTETEVSALLNTLNDFSEVYNKGAKIQEQLFDQTVASLNHFVTSMSEVTARMISATEKFVQAEQLGAERTIQIAELSGKRLGINDLANPSENIIRKLGGSLDPNAIGGHIVRLRGEIAAQEARQQQLTKTGNIEETKNLAIAIQKNTNSLHQAEKALEELSNNTARLTAIQNKLATIEQSRQAQRQFLDKLTVASLDVKSGLDLHNQIRGALGIFGRGPINAEQFTGGKSLLLELSDVLEARFPGSKEKIEAAIANQQTKFLEKNPSFAALPPEIKAIITEFALSRKGESGPEARLIAEFKTASDRQIDAINMQGTLAQLAAHDLYNAQVTRLDSIHTVLDENIRIAAAQLDLTREMLIRMGGTVPTRSGTDVVDQIIKNVLGYAGGGFVGGTYRGQQDTQLAKLVPGEFVVRRNVAQKNAGLLNAMNGNVRGFADGGFFEEGMENISPRNRKILYELRMQQKLREINNSIQPLPQEKSMPQLMLDSRRAFVAERGLQERTNLHDERIKYFARRRQRLANARVTPGEFVVNKYVARRYNKFFRNLNRTGKPRGFAQGGFVGGNPSTTSGNMGFDISALTAVTAQLNRTFSSAIPEMSKLANELARAANSIQALNGVKLEMTVAPIQMVHSGSINVSATNLQEEFNDLRKLVHESLNKHINTITGETNEGFL